MSKEILDLCHDMASPTLINWANGNFESVKNDIWNLIHTIRISSLGKINPANDITFLFLPKDKVNYLTFAHAHGLTVRDVMRDVYPKMSVLSVDEDNWPSDLMILSSINHSVGMLGI